MAAEGGHLDMLKRLRAKEGWLISDWKSNICASAAEQGHLHVLQVCI
jgi:hypothetical protein